MRKLSNVVQNWEHLIDRQVKKAGECVRGRRRPAGACATSCCSEAPGAMRAGLSFYRAAARSAERNRALVKQDKLKMPVLGLSADQGSIADIAATLGPFASDVHGETIAHCGHFQPEEQPQAVADALLHFFGGQG